MQVALFALASWPIGAAGQWVEPPGQGWASFAAYHQDTRESYDRTGQRGDFPGDGHAIATQTFLTAAWGLTTGVDAWAQVAFNRLEFNDLTVRRTSAGPGDVRFYVRFNPLLLRGLTVPVALRGGVKLPVGDFDVGSSVIPLGDGQRDWELMLEAGHSFYPAPFYTMAWLGYRWREPRDGGRVDYGNERFFYAAGGGTAGVVDFKIGVEGWYGDTPIFDAVLAEGAEREMIRFNPSVLIGAGPGQLEIGGRFPLGGHNLPAGPDVVLGYFLRMGGTSD
jgi:hypothetical protein